ncbi:class I SAM-dependent methyltransferase [Ideonella margarita]|uniref:Class I SAM-dependent methyltransferase n=1 Tax=Ideonella margarita TaxID=2984191 RepID=A0ABU9C1Q6_9BURK
MVRWLDADDQPQQAVWRSLAGHAPFERVVLVDDATPADDAYRMARAGTGLLWVGDYQNARHLLQALGRRLKARIDGRRVARPDGAAPALPALGSPAMAEAFAAQRREQNERTRILGALLLPFDADHGVPLRRAPDVREAGLEAHGVVNEPYVASLRELQGVIGAHEWRKTGVPVAALKDNIHPHHGVFSPVRGEYVDLVARTKLPAAAKPARALELGCGSGVLCAVLARRGLWVVATDVSPAALACSEDNLTRLELKERVTLLPQSLYPKGRFGLVVCNPPWVPGPAGSALDGAVYDPDSRMLRGFLDGLAAHLAPGGEGWLILSDLAEHLGLRSREELLGWISAAGLQVLGRTETPPVHARASDAADPLHRARAAEMTSLWRLGRAEAPAPALS